MLVVLFEYFDFHREIANMEIRGIEYEKLSFLSLRLDDRYIPEESGIYFWVHYPLLHPEFGFEEIVRILHHYTRNHLSYEENFQGSYKFRGSITEQWFRPNGRLFGLNEDKEYQLKQHLSDPSQLDSFIEIFRELCFSRPFYIGKANNLKRRLGSHFSRSGSNLLDFIELNNISFEDVWIGFKPTRDSLNPKMNTIIEEIFSRSLKPGLTLKPN